MTQTADELHPHENEDERAYYAQPGPMTALDLRPAVAEGLPADPLGLCRVARGVIVHEFLAASLYGVEIPPERADEVETRPASAIVDTIQALDRRPLVEARPPERRMFGNCRQFSTLTCALLRRAGIPSRARCGFGTYFEDGKYIDHWIVEYWDAAREAWRRVDSQLDDVQHEALSIDFDATDVPGNKFLSGGDAWQLCRAGQADPDTFGILEFWGGWFIRANVVRDLAALNKMELLPWDGWGLMARADELGEDVAERVTDEVADVTVAGEWSDVRRLYEGNDLLRVPAKILSYRSGETVAL
jgi:transglutaminase-like putative cysteine protease